MRESCESLEMLALRERERERGIVPKSDSGALMCCILYGGCQKAERKWSSESNILGVGDSLRQISQIQPRQDVEDRC